VPDRVTEIEVVRAGALGVPEQSRWCALQADDPDLASAFFRPEFCQNVDAITGDVEVAVLRLRGEAAGFWPFQRRSRGVARPVLGRLSEFHGAVIRRGVTWDPAEVLRACGLRAWHFDHVPASDESLAAYRWSLSPSPYVDLSDGYEAYRKQRREEGCALFSQVERKARKLAREVGPLRFEMRTQNPAAFDALLEWKSAQHRRTGVLEVLRVDWVRTVLERLWHTQDDSFSAPLSALYAGDELAAVHLGLSSRRALHVWFPTFDLRFGKYTPGLILFLEMARAAAAAGIERIDLGKGSKRYKQSLRSGNLMLAEGGVDVRPVLLTARRSWHRAKQRMKSSRWRAQLEIPLTASRRVRQWWAFR
jgi:CelD/BcsL family acetyltransferase involved in cellulose biosynthesis